LSVKSRQLRVNARVDLSCGVVVTVVCSYWHTLCI